MRMNYYWKVVRSKLEPIVVANIEDKKINKRDVYDPNSQNIVVLRDIANTIASIIKRGFTRRVPFDLLWMQYYNSDAVKINFNKWHIDGQYRGQLLESFGLDYDETPYNDIPRMGGGSSWGGLRNNPLKLDLQHRYKLVDQDKLLDRLLQCPNSVVTGYEYFRDVMTDDLKSFYEYVIDKLRDHGLPEPSR